MARLARTSGHFNVPSYLLFPPHFIYPALSKQDLLTVRFSFFSFSDKKKKKKKKKKIFEIHANDACVI